MGLICVILYTIYEYTISSICIIMFNKKERGKLKSLCNDNWLGKKKLDLWLYTTSFTSHANPTQSALEFESHGYKIAFVRALCLCLPMFDFTIQIHIYGSGGIPKKEKKLTTYMLKRENKHIMFPQIAQKDQTKFR